MKLCSPFPKVGMPILTVLFPILVYFAWVRAEVIVLSPHHQSTSYPDRAAAFGPPIPREGLEGYLVPLDYLDPLDETLKFGCKPLQLSRHSIGRPLNWIALVQRGECSFADKVRAMQASGAASVIVGDNKPNNTMIRMFSKGDTSDIRIPSAFVAGWEYTVLKFLARENAGMPPLSMDIFFDSKATGDIQGDEYVPKLWVKMVTGREGYHLTAVDLVILLFLAPALFFFIFLLVWYHRRRSLADDLHLNDASDSRSRRVNTVSLHQVTTLPTVTFRYHHDDIENLGGGDFGTCTICLEEYKFKEKLIELPKCGHLFHTDCLVPWMTVGFVQYVN